jgi:glycosyltransferase involved in cell wall biosynthesis
MKMRVAFDGRSLASPVLRGWDRYTVGLVGELVRRGIDVTLFHRKREMLHAPHLDNLGCRVVGLRDRGGLHWEQVAVPIALWRGRYDVFHAPAEHGVPLASPCPVVLTYHSVTLHSYHDLVRRGLLPGRLRDYLGYDGDPNRRTPAATYMRAQIARADHVIAPSEFCRQEIIRFLRAAPNRVSVTPLAVHEQFRRPPSTPEQRAAVLAQLGIRSPYLLYVGGYEPHKNVAGLLGAFAAVKRARPDLLLVLVGSKSLPEALPAHAARLKLRPDYDVRFLVNLTTDLTDVYDGAELFVTLSWRETFCLPALEAITRGIPVVASEWGAAGEVLRGAGRLVDPRDTDQAAGAIVDVLQATSRLSVNRHSHEAARTHTWRETARKTLQVYSRLAG